MAPPSPGRPQRGLLMLGAGVENTSIDPRLSTGITSHVSSDDRRYAARCPGTMWACDHCPATTDCPATTALLVLGTKWGDTGSASQQEGIGF